MTTKPRKPRIRASAAVPRGNTRPVADVILDGLLALEHAVRRGEPLEQNFSVRHVIVADPPRTFSPRRVRALRRLLRVSQSVFAAMLGVSVKTVQAWEQGARPPGLARRTLEMIERDPEPWRRLVQVQPDSSPPPRRTKLARRRSEQSRSTGRSRAAA